MSITFRRFLLALAAVFVAFAGASATGSTSAQALTNCTVSTDALDAQEQAFLTLINNYRVQNGRTALKVSTNLNRASAWLATDMGVNRYFSHTDRLGRSPSTRAQNCDYPGGAGENIAAGTNWDTAQEAFDAWKNSSGHNTNMLNPSYRVIGIARVYTAGSPYGYYWVTNFGLVDDGTSTATPTATATNSPTQTSTPTPTATSTPTATATPTSTATATTTTQPSLPAAKVSAPVAGSRLTTSWNYFSWNRVTGATSSRLEFGTSKGSANLGTVTTTSTATYVSGVPRGYATIYVRLWTKTSGGWAYTDTTYLGPR